MANEVAVRQAEVVLSPADAAKYARAFYGANIYKSGGNKLSVEEIFVVIMAGQEYGWGPAASMSNLNLMDGRPELSADAQARFIKAGGKYEYRITEHTDEACEITVLAAPTGEIIGVERFTMDDAKRMGIKMTTQRGQPTNWAKVPRNMLFARCISNVCAFHCPDAVPMRTYAIGEIDGENRQDEDEPQEIAPEQAAALQVVEDTVAEEIANGDPEGEAEDEAIHQALMGMQAEAMALEDPSDDPVYTRFIEDSARLNDGEKNLVRQLVEEAGVPFKTSEIVKMMKARGFTDVQAWLAFSGSWVKPIDEPDAVFLPSGMTAETTGSQNAMKTISDKQMRMFNAKCGEAHLTPDQRKKVMLRYTGVTSSKQIAAKDFDDLLAVLEDIIAIPVTDTEIRAAYL